MNAPADSFEEEPVTPIWTLYLVLGFSVADVSITDAKYPAKQARPVLTMLVRDLVGIDPAIRDIARSHAIEILNRAGVELRWIDANGTEDPNLASTTKSYATVVIAKEAPSGWTSPDAMGFAPARNGPYPRAYVFTSLVRTFVSAFVDEFKSQGKSAFGIILGHAIVHELGHLLIPGDAHGDGIMRPNWAYREWVEALQGSLLFAPSQAQLIRQTLQSNCGYLAQEIPCVLESPHSQPEHWHGRGALAPGR
jgi:hypothetical protein